RLDGRGPVLRALGLSHHRHPARREGVRWIFSELLRAALPADLAAVLRRAPFHVRCRPAAATRAGLDDLRAVVAVVGVSVLSAESPGTQLLGGCRSPGRHVVARDRGAVLPGLAAGGPVSLDGAAAGPLSGRDRGVA